MGPKKPTNGDVIKMVEEMDDDEIQKVLEDEGVKEVLRKRGIKI